MMETREVIEDLALNGRGHVHASYVAKQAEIATEDAHKQLLALQSEGIVEVNFDVICPDNLRTIMTFHLEEEIPWGEWVPEPTGDCEPFKLTEEDIDVTYSPTHKFQQRLLRSGERSGSKKKSLRTLVKNVFRLSRSSKKKATERSSSTSKTVRVQRSSRREATALPGR